MTLYDFVAKHAVRGACQCGNCADAPENPASNQPGGHTADLTFFKVAAKDAPDPAEFKRLVETEFPRWLDGKEHSYLETGGDMGDQGIALTTMGLGAVLGVWNVLSPASLGFASDDPLAQQMAGMGYVTIQAQP